MEPVASLVIRLSGRLHHLHHVFILGYALQKLSSSCAVFSASQELRLLCLESQTALPKIYLCPLVLYCWILNFSVFPLPLSMLVGDLVLW